MTSPFPQVILLVSLLLLGIPTAIWLIAAYFRLGAFAKPARVIADDRHHVINSLPK